MLFRQQVISAVVKDDKTAKRKDCTVFTFRPRFYFYFLNVEGANVTFIVRRLDEVRFRMPGVGSGVCARCRCISVVLVTDYADFFCQFIREGAATA